jgi:hypothetical protein
VYKQRALLLWLLEKEKGHVYVCGSAAMANGVRNSFHTMLQTEKGLDKKQAHDCLHYWIVSFADFPLFNIRIVSSLVRRLLMSTALAAPIKHNRNSA